MSAQLFNYVSDQTIDGISGSDKLIFRHIGHRYMQIFK